MQHRHEAESPQAVGGAQTGLGLLQGYGTGELDTAKPQDKPEIIRLAVAT